VCGGGYYVSLVKNIHKMVSWKEDLTMYQVLYAETEDLLRRGKRVPSVDRVLIADFVQFLRQEKKTAEQWEVEAVSQALERWEELLKRII
jgi:hypothetical protein